MTWDKEKRLSGRFISILVFLIIAAAALAFCFAAASLSVAAEDLEYHDNEVEASEELRQILKERKSTATIGIKGKTDQEGLQQIIGRLMAEATEHTGKPDEGDYLLFQYASYKGQGRTALSGVSPVVELEYDMSYYDDAKQEEEVSDKVKEILKNLDLDNKTDYEKISAIHDYICDNIEYESSEEGSDIRRTAYGALIEGRAVCQGYSVCLYRLLLEAGIDNRIIFGTGVSPLGINGPHTWNIVKLYGKYYYLDCTWDDCDGSRDFFLLPAGSGFEDEHIAGENYGEDFFEQYPMADEKFNADTDGLLAALQGLAHSIEESIIKPFKRTEE
ncbi:MAG: hypothetical protein IKG17_10530 [Mogibacterium sp.]|jgi:hypothetical protein|nr:hypothetical protein [Mogibacterium sp.]